VKKPSKVTVSYRFPVKVADTIKKLAAAADMTKTEYVLAILSKALGK
jgi:hypothetical protein